MYQNDVELINKYLNYIALYKSEGTIKTYKSCIKSFYEYLINQNINELNQNLFSIVSREILEDYIYFQCNKGLGADIIHCKIMAIKSYFKFLLKSKLINTETFFELFNDLKTPKIIVKSQIVVKADSVINLEKIMKNKNNFVNKRNVLMIFLMSNTGIRRKEVGGINVKDINLNNNTIAIYKTKGSKPRIISFSEMLKDKLIDYLKDRDVVLRKKHITTNNLLIKSDGKDLGINSITTIMHIISKENNQKITCHSLRRGFATDMAEGGTDVYVLSKMMGHENINTTVARYIYVFVNIIKDAMDKHPFSNKLKQKEIKEIKTNIEQDDILHMFTTLNNQISDISKRIDMSIVK